MVCGATSHALPIYTGVLLQHDGRRLHLSVANDSLWATTAIPTGGGEPGQAVVDAKQFAALARRLPGIDAVLQYEDGALAIRSGKMKAGLATMLADDFPDAPERGEQILHMSSDQINNIMARVGMCVKKDGAYSVFAGILLQVANNALHAVATDTTRLAAMEIWGAKGAGEWIIPAEALSQAVKAVGDGDVDIYASDTHICLDSDDATTYIQLLAGKFPDWDRVIPTGKQCSGYCQP